MTAVPIESDSTDSNEPQILCSVAPFEGLTAPVLDIICERSERRAYDAGQTVFSLGQFDGSEFLVVLDGALRVSITEGDSGEMVLEDISAGEVFGLEFAMAEPDPASFQQIAVTASTDCDLILIEAGKFKSLAGGRPSLMRNVAIYLAEKLSAHRFKAEAAHAAPAQRVYAVLLKCIERDPLTGHWKINRMPKHRELADRAGVDEAIAANAVATLIQDGVAQREYPGLVVNDLARLNKLAG